MVRIHKLLFVYALLSIFGCNSVSDKNILQQKVRDLSAQLSINSKDDNSMPQQRVSESRAESYFKGDGGKNTSIAILQPTSKSVAKNEEWLLTFIQGTITGDFNRYSAMKVIDRQNLEKIIENQNTAASGYFSDTDFISIGNLTNAQYILVGSIEKLANNMYTFELSISDAAKGERKASFSPVTCGFSELQSLSIVKKAMEDLLTQMGIELTPSGRQNLHTVQRNTIEAETALSKGIVAGRNGTVVEAMSYYYNAVSFDSSLGEASSRLSIITSEISSGNIGANVRNDIQRRNEWKKILDEAEVFFKAHLPFEIIYDPNLKQGRIDYQRETVDMSCFLEARPTDGFKVLETIRKGLIETEKMEEWGFSLWPLHRSDMFVPYTDVYSNYPDHVVAHLELSIVAGLYNEQSKQLSTSGLDIRNYIGFYAVDRSMQRPLPKGYLGNRYSQTHDSNIVDTNRFSFFTGTDIDLRRVVQSRIASINFRNVNANDITDNLVVKIISVNGIDAETAGATGYIRIASKN